MKSLRFLPSFPSPDFRLSPPLPSKIHAFHRFWSCKRAFRATFRGVFQMSVDLMTDGRSRADLGQPWSEGLESSLGLAENYVLRPGVHARNPYRILSGRERQRDKRIADAVLPALSNPSQPERRLPDTLIRHSLEGHGDRSAYGATQLSAGSAFRRDLRATEISGREDNFISSAE